MFRARGRPSVRLAPVWTYTRGQRELAAQLRGPTGRPRRAAAPLKPKALSHEEAPTPPPRHTPLHEAPRPWARDPRPARDSRARRGGGVEGGGYRGAGRGCARTVSCRGRDRGPAQPRPGGRQAAGSSYQRGRHGVGEALRDGRTGGRAAGRRGEGRTDTWALFLQRAEAAYKAPRSRTTPLRAG